MGAEILCPACGQEALLRREPVYEGLRKTGEQCSCASCGHRFSSADEIPFKQREGPQVFSEADKSKTIDVFADDEHKRLCRYCKNYVVNPFTEWCSTHHKEVTATDGCDRFEPVEDA